MASRPPKHPGPLLPRLESGRQLVAPEAEPSPSKLQLPALALPADEPDRRDEAFSLFVERTSARESGRKGKRKSRSAGGKDSGRGPRPPRADDCSAYFHHHPWRGSALDLAPRLLRRLGSGGASGGHRGRDDDDDDDDDGAELEVAAHGSEWFAAVLGEPCCVLRLDAKKAVSDALRSGCGEACAVVAEIRRAAGGRRGGAALRALGGGRVPGRLPHRRRRPGARGARHGARPTRAALHWTGEAVAVEAGAEGRPHSAALAVVADELELLGDAGIAVSAAAKQRLDGEAVAPPLGLFARSGFAWTFLPETRWAEGSRPAPLRGDRKTVVMATLAFDAKLAREAGSARLFVQRRRAVAVLQTALGCGGGERAPGSDALYVFDSVAAGLLAALDAKAALDKFVAQALVDVAAAGFGIAAGELVAAPGATTGACVAVAARLCHELAGRATPGGVLVDGPARAELGDLAAVRGRHKPGQEKTGGAKRQRRADYGAARDGRPEAAEGPQLDATCASALEELRAVTEPGDVEVERVLRNLLDALRAGKNDAVVKSRRRELLQLHARWCPRSALRTDHTPAERESQAALADWYRGAGKSARSGSKAFAPERRRARKLRRKRETASDRIQTAFRVAPTMVKARARAKRAQKRTKAAFDAAKIGKFGRGWAKTASRALWPGARDVRAAKTPASALAVLVDAAGGRASRAESLRERTDEEKAAGAAGIRARIQYLRSRCSDPAAIDAELAADPRLLMGGPAGLSRVEALFANAQLEAAEDAEATAEAAGATAEAPAAADAAADEEEDDDAEDDDDASSDGDASGDAVVDEAKERRRAERRAARKAEKKRLRDEAKRARAEESLPGRARPPPLAAGPSLTNALYLGMRSAARGFFERGRGAAAAAAAPEPRRRRSTKPRRRRP
ncbi:hypothetical protein JL721_3369 [Aureococcus anophagefferens]|nr:hypothetical protein JL721_3369 [Aureococcus anophagefferens]